MEPPFPQPSDASQAVNSSWSDTRTPKWPYSLRYEKPSNQISGQMNQPSFQIL